jgi:putative membrane protein
MLDFVMYFSFSVFSLIVFSFLYIKTTPYNEIELIFNEGNKAASYAFIGALIGFTLPIASVAIHSLSFEDFAKWAIISVAIQLVFAIILTRGFKIISNQIKSGLDSAGIFLGGSHLSLGIINAACVSY